MARRILAVMLTLGVLAHDAAFARQPKQVPIAWNEIENIIVEQRISTVLPDGVRLQGEVLAVRPESLVMDVHKSSNKRLHPAAQTEIPRASITQIQVIRHQGAAIRVLGGVLGAVGGLALTGAVGVATESAAAFFPCLLIVVPVSVVAGYYAGKIGDRRITRLAITPEVSHER